MRTGLGFLAGLGAGSILLALLRPVLASAELQRQNHRGHHLPTAGGVVAVIACLFAAAIWRLFEPSGSAVAVLPVVLGFGLLGFVDDVVGAGTDGRGFVGHVRALAHGRLTTGGLKLLGGAAVGIAAAAYVDGDRPMRLVCDAALVALAANFGNLLDRAPGRTLKAGALAAAVIVAVGGASAILVGPAIAVGASLSLLPADLGERLMLGDTGANAFGGAIAFGLLLTASFPARLVVLAALVVLNGLSEVVSYSAVIDRVAPLRWVDRAGRRPR